MLIDICSDLFEIWYHCHCMFGPIFVVPSISKICVVRLHELVLLTPLAFWERRETIQETVELMTCEFRQPYIK